jgi:uncharacterized protein
MARLVAAVLFLAAPALGIGCSNSLSEDPARLAAFRAKHPLGVVQVHMVPMTDGTKLHTEIISTTNRTTEMPTVIDRSPYGGTSTELVADIYAALGDFVAIGQDMRGTCKSEGNFSLWRKDGDDAYDTFAWVAAQSWSNGQVYTVGASADGVAQFVQPKRLPPNLISQFIIVATIDARSTVFPGGAYRHGLIDNWLHGTVPHQADALIVDVKSRNGASAWWDPLNMSAPENWDNIRAPAVMWGGWYDIFLQGNLNGHYIYQNLAHESVRGKSYLVVDPLGHCEAATKFFPGNIGHLDGRAALGALLSIQMVEGGGVIDAPAENVKFITFYVMGPDPNIVGTKGVEGNYWCTLDEWPTPTDLTLFLGTGSKTTGTLSTTAPVNPVGVAFTYDPKNPVPTLGGNNLEVKPCGPVDQTPVETRPDVLLHTTAPLAEDTYVTGPLFATLFVSSDMVDTDFTAKLTDVYPDGSSHLIQDGIFRMRWREGENADAASASFWPVAPTPVVPGTTYKINVNLWNTSYVFNKGHSVRVAVSSSNSPKYKANPNLGLDLNEEDKHEPKVATNTLFYGGATASHFTLPTVTKAQLPKKILLDPAAPAAGNSVGEQAWRKHLPAAASLTKWAAQRMAQTAEAAQSR